MIKIFEIEESFNDMRLDRWIRNKFGKVPQGLIEKNIRNGARKKKSEAEPEKKSQVHDLFSGVHNFFRSSREKK